PPQRADNLTSNAPGATAREAIEPVPRARRIPCGPPEGRARKRPRPMPPLMIPGFTRSLDSAIADQRVRHAAERLDFHAHFELMTVEKLLRILRKEDRRDHPDAFCPRRQDLVVDLLDAQQEHPHGLW